MLAVLGSLAGAWVEVMVNWSPRKLEVGKWSTGQHVSLPSCSTRPPSISSYPVQQGNGKIVFEIHLSWRRFCIIEF